MFLDARPVAAHPAVVDYHVTDGPSWRLSLSGEGARTARLPVSNADPAAAGDLEVADASARASAGDLVLVLYGRAPVDFLKLTGRRVIFDQLVAWDPDA